MRAQQGLIITLTAVAYGYPLESWVSEDLIEALQTLAQIRVQTQPRKTL